MLDHWQKGKYTIALMYELVRFLINFLPSHYVWIKGCIRASLFDPSIGRHPVPPFPPHIFMAIFGNFQAGHF